MIWFGLASCWVLAAGCWYVGCVCCLLEFQRKKLSLSLFLDWRLAKFIQRCYGMFVSLASCVFVYIYARVCLFFFYKIFFCNQTFLSLIFNWFIFVCSLVHLLFVSECVSLCVCVCVCKCVSACFWYIICNILNWFLPVFHYPINTN